MLEAIQYLHVCEIDHKRKIDPPMVIVTNAWLPHVTQEEGNFDQRAYLFCALNQLRSALRRRDVFADPSWRYADPRKGLLSDADWAAARPVICRTLGFSPDAFPRTWLPALPVAGIPRILSITNSEYRTIRL